MTRIALLFVSTAIACLSGLPVRSATAQELLETQLKNIAPQQLANQAFEQGNAQRGALLFYQADMNCAKVP